MASYRRAEEVVDEVLRHLPPELRTLHVRMPEVHPAKHAGVRDSLSMSLNVRYVRIDGDTGAGGLMVSMRIGVSPPWPCRRPAGLHHEER
jgi:hypothetical protein